MTTRAVFRDPDLQHRYDALGYVTFPLLDAEAVARLRDGYRQFTLEDRYGIGYTVSLYSSDLETRRRAREFLVSSAFPALEPLLVDRQAYMATYLVKEPGGRFIPPHQDWTHCDEDVDDSVMCWIPLCDVNEDNGGLGFIDGSHRYFDYLRAFPYLVANTPVDRHGGRLLTYLNMLPMRAGDVVVFNNRVIHGSLPNTGAEPRMALSFALHPARQPLLAYYLEPKAQAKSVLRYRADPEFYLCYNNPRMVEEYSRGNRIDGYAYERLPYDMPSIAWETFESLLHASGNRRDPRKAALAQALVGARVDAT